MRVVRLYHGGRDPSHRERDRALVRAGVEVVLAVPSAWPGVGSRNVLPEEPFEVIELPMVRSGDVNRHRLADPAVLGRLVARVRPDVVDLHEEPFSAVVHQVLRQLPPDQTVVAYTAQNLDKRFPPPFAQWERAALSRVSGLYPCSRQAASVAVGKGFVGAVRVLPLPAPTGLTAGAQSDPSPENLELLLLGRLVPEKGVIDAIQVLDRLRRGGRVHLTVVGTGPEGEHARAEARRLGRNEDLTVLGWQGADALGALYRAAHVVLVPSRRTATWVEQFGRTAVEARAAGAVVAAYATGSLPEVVGSVGAVVPEGDIKALADAVDGWRAHPSRWRGLREDGLALAAGETWEGVAQGQAQLYDTVRGGRARWPARPNRTAAQRSWGVPARGDGPPRPFALPVLRDGCFGARSLARVVDLLGRTERPEAPQELRVVYLDHVAALSGGEVALARLLPALPGVRAHVILAENGPLCGRLEAGGATVEVLALDPRARDTRRDEVATVRSTARVALVTAWYVVRLTRRLRELNPDLVHTNSLKSGFYGAPAARLAGLPVLWHLRDRITPDYLPPRVVTLTRAMLRVLPHVVLCNSAATLATTALTPGRGSVVATGVIHGTVPAAGPSVARVLHDIYPHEPEERVDTSGPFTVVLIGRLAPWKGQDVLLRALAEPGAELIHARVVGSAMFGEDKWATELTRLAAELGVADRVVFTGFTDNVQAELNRSDVLVHTSVIPEPFGQVVVEGMAAGLPVIASDAGGPAEIITNGVNGVLVPPGDHTILARALAQLASDPAQRARLGEAGRTRAADFAPQIIGPQIVALYRQLVVSRPKRKRLTRRGGTLHRWIGRSSNS